MRVKILLWLVFCLTISLTNQLHSAQIDLVHTEEELADIWLVGEIEKGDAEKIMKIIEDARQKKLILKDLYLSSNGGNVFEAIKIGNIVRKSFLSTYAPYSNESDVSCPPAQNDSSEQYDCNCASACFFIWAAGVQRTGKVLGIHRPYFSEEDFQQIPASEAQKAYVFMSEKVRSYLKYMDIPEQIIEKIFNTGSKDILYLDQDTVESLEWTPFFDEYIGAGCSKLSAEEAKDFLHFFGILHRDFSNAEDVYFNFLSNKALEYRQCLLEKLKAAQFGEVSTVTCYGNQASINKSGSLIIPKEKIEELGFKENDTFTIRKTKSGISLKIQE